MHRVVVAIGNSSDLFSHSLRYGDINSVRLLPPRRCAFVNYKDPESAAEALKGLQVS